MIGDDVRKVPADADGKVKSLMAKLDRGIKRRRQEEKRWEHNEKFEDMKQWDGELGQGDQVTVNKTGSYIRNYRAQVAYNNPHCKCTPKTADGWNPIQVPVAGPGGQPEMDPQTGQIMTREVVPAEAREALIDSIISAPMQNIQQTSGLLAKAGVVGYGVIKSVYNPIFSTPQETSGEQKIPFVEGNLDLSGLAKNPATGEVIYDEDRNRLIKRDEIPVWEDFEIKWVSYRNIIADPDGGNYWEDHDWVAEEELVCLKQAKAEPLYKNTDDLKASGKRDEEGEFKINYEGSDWSPEEDHDYSNSKDMVRIFHLYDVADEKYYVLADGHTKILREETWDDLGIVDHPYSDFRPNQILGEFYPRPPATDLAPINEWYNEARRLELTAMRRSIRKNIVRKGAFGVDGMDQLTNDEDMAWAELDTQTNLPFGELIMQLQPPPLSADIYRNSQMIANDFAEVGGMTDEARGKASADSATQANIMEQYSGTRIAHDRKIMAETWRRAFKKLNDHIDRNMTVARAVRLQGTDGMTFNALVDPDLIAGDYDYDVDFEDLAEANTAAQSAGRAQIAQIAGQAPHLFTSEPLVRGWLEPFGIKDQNFIDALVEASKMQMQMLAAQAAPPQGPVPEAGAPGNEADAISQSAAGGQVPRMSSAT